MSSENINPEKPSKKSDHSGPFDKFLWLDFFTRKNETQKETTETLKLNLLFKNLTNYELKLISRMVHQRRYERNESIFTQGEKGLGMYMIVKGRIEIQVHADGPLEPSVRIVTTLTDGSFFGELALIDDHNKRTASAFAKGPTTLLGFFKPDLMQIIERKPDVGVKILIQLSKILGKRLTETTELISQMTVRIDKDAPA